MNCSLCGRRTIGGGKCPDCSQDERVVGGVDVCSEPGCGDETAFCSPFCPTHDAEVDR